MFGAPNSDNTEACIKRSRPLAGDLALKHNVRAVLVAPPRAFPPLNHKVVEDPSGGLLGVASGFAQPKIRSTQKSIWINLFAQLNPGFGRNNYLLNWGTAPRSLVFIGGFLLVSVVYAALLSGFGVLWWVSVMLVSFLLGFGVFFDGVWCFLGVQK